MEYYKKIEHKKKGIFNITFTTYIAGIIGEKYVEVHINSYKYKSPTKNKVEYIIDGGSYFLEDYVSKYTKIEKTEFLKVFQDTVTNIKYFLDTN